MVSISPEMLLLDSLSNWNHKVLLSEIMELNTILTDLKKARNKQTIERIITQFSWKLADDWQLET